MASGFMNLKNFCVFEGRPTKNIKVTSINTRNGNMTRVQFSLNVMRKLTAAEKTAVANGDQTIVRSDFVNCVILGQKADNFLKYCGEGIAIQVIGAYSTWKSTGQNGQTSYGHNFEVVEWEFCTQNAQNAQSGVWGGQQYGNGQAPAEQNQGGYPQQPQQGGMQPQGQGQPVQQQGYPQQGQGNYQQQPMQNAASQGQPGQQQQQNGWFQMFDNNNFPF